MSVPAVPRGRAACLLAALSAGACVATDPDPQWKDRAPAVVEASAFPPRAGLPAGFDAPEPGRGIECGDRLVFGLRLDDHGERRDWFVDVEVIDPASRASPAPRAPGGGEGGSLLACVRVLDADGRQLSGELVPLARASLALFRATGAPGDLEARARRLVQPRPGDAAPRRLLAALRRCKALQDVVWQVVDGPSLLSVIAHLGVRVTQRSWFEEVRAGPAFACAGQQLPTLELPVEVLANGAPAVRGVVVATDPDSPFGLCAGVVAVTASRPSDPGVCFSVRLLSARRGDAGEAAPSVARAASAAAQ